MKGYNRVVYFECICRRHFSLEQFYFEQQDKEKDEQGEEEEEEEAEEYLQIRIIMNMI